MRFKPTIRPSPAVRRARAAFTLVEVLAALTLMAIVIPVAVDAMRLANLAGQVGQRKAVAGVGYVPMIRFTPDGFIGETSPERIGFRQGKDDPTWVVESTNRLKYEIQVSYSPKAPR